jgi:hypothetical protein
LKYGEKKGLDMNRTSKRLLRKSDRKSDKVEQGPLKEKLLKDRESLNISDDDLISVDGDDENTQASLELDITNEELLLRAEIFSNFLKDDIAELFEGEQVNF